MRTIKVCVGNTCHLKGSYKVLSIIQEYVKANRLSHEIELRGTFCLGRCTEGVSVQIDEGDIFSVTPETAEDFISNILQTA